MYPKEYTTGDKNDCAILDDNTAEWAYGGGTRIDTNTVLITTDSSTTTPMANTYLEPICPITTPPSQHQNHKILEGRVYRELARGKSELGMNPKDIIASALEALQDFEKDTQ